MVGLLVGVWDCREKWGLQEVLGALGGSKFSGEGDLGGQTGAWRDW